MKHSHRIMRGCVSVALAGWSVSGSAAGFALIEQNASGLGNAYAGQAASAQDASTVFFNPAGMSKLQGNQLVVVGNAIRPSAQFLNASSGLAAAQVRLGDNGPDAGGWAYVPNFYFASSLTSQISVGVGVNTPFGLKTDYNSTWAGRFYAIKSDLKTYNVNPSIAYKLSDGVALGAGINFQRATVELTNNVNYSGAAFAAGGLPALGAVGGAGVEGLAKLTGADNAWGFNVGALFNPTPDTQIGLTYRSSLSYKLSGSVAFSNRPALLAAALPDGGISADLKLPASVSIALTSKLSPKWDLLADASWAQWSSFQNLTVLRSTGVLLSTVPENWRDSWRVGAGLNYHYNDSWTSRIGVAFDQTPVPEAFRTPRIPDNDRTWLAIGGQYKITKQNVIDFGYAHLWVRGAPVNLPASTYPAGTNQSNGTLAGNYSNKVDLVSVQYTHSF